MRLLSKKHHRAIDHACSIVYLRSMLCGRNCGIGMMQYYMLSSGVAKVGNGWAQAQPIMSSAQPIFMSIVQPIYAPFHVKIYNK